ncbi:MAG: dockerin type I repeat-containing protein [Clostridia bacterium]|nr:dockerin type I repeat-containing protein [Clostridia bacterium]
MKKFMTLALAIAMLMTIVPATLAAPAAKTGSLEKSQTLEAAQKVEMPNVSSSLENVNKKYLPTSLSKDLTKATYEEVETLGVAEIPLEDGAFTGYWLDNAEEGVYYEVTDWYTDGTPVYLHRFATVEESTVKAYAEGDTLFFNYDLYQSFENGMSTDLPEREEGYELSCFVLGGELQADGNTISLNIVGEWSSFEGGLSVSCTAPVDDYYFFFVMVVEQVAELEDGFGAWMNISSVESDADFRTVPKGADVKVGETFTTDIGASGTKLVVAPLNSTFTGTYAQAHKIQLEGGKQYIMGMNSPDNIGGHIWFCDENMDVINDTFIAAEWVGEIDYAQVDSMVWPTETGTYYIVVGGYWATDEGELDVTVVEWNDYEGEAFEIPEVNEVIDFAEVEDGDVGDGDTWAYVWSAENDMGVLVVGGMPGTYTLKGDGSKVTVVVIEGGVKLVYDNATTNALQLQNEYSPVSVEAKGKSAIANAEGFAVVNSVGAVGGLYITGEELTVSGIFGIVLEDSALHVSAKKLIVDTTSMEGYLPISVWVVGMMCKHFTVGSGAKFDGDNKVTKLFYEENRFFQYGYGVSEYDELSRYVENEGDASFENASLYFELTTEGGFGGAGMLGDANEDGNVNTGDATMILKHAASILVLEGTSFANADINQDGNVNTGDATMVLKVAAGIIPNPNEYLTN